MTQEFKDRLKAAAIEITAQRSTKNLNNTLEKCLFDEVRRVGIGMLTRFSNPFLSDPYM